MRPPLFSLPSSLSLSSILPSSLPSPFLSPSFPLSTSTDRQRRDSRTDGGEGGLACARSSCFHGPVPLKALSHTTRYAQGRRTRCRSDPRLPLDEIADHRWTIQPNQVEGRYKLQGALGRREPTKQPASTRIFPDDRIWGLMKPDPVALRICLPACLKAARPLSPFFGALHSRSNIPLAPTVPLPSSQIDPHFPA